MKNICYAENSKIINWCMTKINDIFINNVATNIEISIDNDLEPWSSEDVDKEMICQSGKKPSELN